MHFDIGTRFFRDLQADLGRTCSEGDKVATIQDAYSLYGWAVKEAAAGRAILSANPDGSSPHRLAMRSLLPQG